jgi:deazaflavin-dependent oxidoreductase (nitroreductase family)
VAGQPAGALRWLLRVPAVLYRWHAGWLLGHRFLLLRHTGRRSGAAYHTVLEVMHYDAVSGAATCMSGWGTGADWYRNIMAGPAVVTIGRRTFPAVPQILDHDHATAVLAGYEARNAWMRPVVRRVLSHLSGLDYDGSDAARRELAAQLPLVTFTPRQAG